MKKTPKIRFKGFTDDWEQRKVKDLFRITRGYVLPAIETSEKMTDETPYPVYSSQTKENGLMGYYSNYLYEDAITWTTDGANAGTVNYRTGKFYCTNVCGVLLSDVVSANQMIAEALNNIAKGYVSYVGNPKLMNNVMADIEFNLPNQEEERVKISEYFHNLDHLITLHQRKCDLLIKTKKFMLQKMFPKKDASKPEIRFAGFTDAWEQRKLGELSLSFEYGLNVAAKEFDGENKYIRITDIDDSSHGFVTDNVTSPDTDLSTADNYKLSIGDILFARTGASVGKSYIYKDSDGLVYYAGFLIRARIKKEYNPEFVFQNTLTTDYEKYIAIISQRSGQPGANAQEYSEYKIMIPNRDEQDKISVCLRNFDHLITLHQRKLELMKNIKKAMLEKMFV